MRPALICAWSAMLLAALLVLPFLDTPFTIDDPIYLREAQHILVDPLHPQAFSMVWSTDLKSAGFADPSRRYRVPLPPDPYRVGRLSRMARASHLTGPASRGDSCDRASGSALRPGPRASPAGCRSDRSVPGCAGDRRHRHARYRSGLRSPSRRHDARSCRFSQRRPSTSPSPP